jgi:hypothetical protein
MKTVGEDEDGLIVNVVDSLGPYGYVYARELDRALLRSRRRRSEDQEAGDNPCDSPQMSHFSGYSEAVSKQPKFGAAIEHRILSSQAR